MRLPAGWCPLSVMGLTALDRHHIETAVEGSLRRLNTDYIDLYQIHWPDPITPMLETMDALDRLVQAGKSALSGHFQ